LSLSAAGLSASKGLAIFGVTKGSMVIVLPVADRDKFLAVAHGTKGADVDKLGDVRCKPIRGVYACAEDVAQIATLGKGTIRGQLAHVGVRGDIEVAGTVDKTSFALVAQLSRGAFVVRGTVDGLPKELREPFGRSGAAVPRDAAGFGWVSLQPLLTGLVAQVPHAPIVGGVTAADVVGAFLGIVHIVAAGGSNQVEASLPLRDHAPLATLLEHCADLPLGGKLVAGTCRFENPLLGRITPEVWVEGDELHVRVELPTPAGAASAMTPIGAELARDEWSMVFWGRGTGLASSFDLSSVLADANLTNGLDAATVGALARGLVMINELGNGLAIDGDRARFVFAVRTAWANPDDVVAKLSAITGRDILTGHARAAGQAIADAAPSSLFAADFHAGATGGAISLVPVGALAAIAIPAFLEYLRKSKKSEGELHMQMIGKAAKRVYGETGAFPIGKTALLPANPTRNYGNNCCGGYGGVAGAPGRVVSNRCTADPAAFARDPVWHALDVSIDEPSVYQYDYQSDGKTFTARAIGDADCDGSSATWELHGSVDAAGNPHVDLVKPQPGVY
jgi:Tfp pilus assembly protein PilE